MDLGVTLSDYQVEGHGNSTAAELAELTKAMYAGDITGRDTDGLSTTGEALKVESLENTLKVLTTSEKDIVLWKKVPKLPAYNTVEEYNQLESYGADDYSFNNEGELPEESDSNHIRQSQLVKYMGTTRQVTHPMMLVKTNIGNAVQQQIQHGTQKILRDVNRQLTIADSAMTSQQFNGYYAQQRNAFATEKAWYDSDVVIDLKGKNLREADVENGSLAVLENNGDASLLMGPPKVVSNFVKSFYSSKLIAPNSNQVTAGVMGQAVTSVVTEFGTIDLGYDKFMKSAAAKTLASSASSTKAPNAPTVGATHKAAVTDPNNEFGSAFAGDYRYAVSAVNRYGESALTEITAAPGDNVKLSISATEAADLEFVDGGGAVAATHYQIYKSVKDVTGTAAQTQFYPVFKVSKAQLANGYNGAAAGKVRDLNYFIANTDSAFMIDPSSEVWSFKQLAPLMKMDLAQLGPAIRFMILLYGTPILYAPKKMVRFINVGSDLS